MWNLKLQTGEDNPVLRMKASNVEKFDQILYELVLGMEEIMGNEGIGIAGPQVGVSKRVFLFTEFDDKNKELELKVAINPEILEFSKEEESMEEGCLSLPKVRGDVVRPIGVRVRYFDLEGNEIEEELDGLTARVFQHEYDHIEGVLFIDRMSPDAKIRKVMI